MLGPEFEDLGHSGHQGLEVGVREALASPLVLRALPDLGGKFIGSGLPVGSYLHALVQLDSNVSEGALPDVNFLELLLDALSKRSRNCSEEPVHSVFRICRRDIRILPELVQDLAELVSEAGH